MFLKVSCSPKKELPWFLQRALVLHPSWAAAGKLAVNDLVNDGVVHGCWLGKQCWYHWELDGDWIWLSKGWPDRDHGVRDPGNEEPCADQHCHLVRAEKRQQGLSRTARHWQSSTQLGRMQGNCIPLNGKEKWERVFSYKFTIWTKSASLSHACVPIAWAANESAIRPLKTQYSLAKYKESKWDYRK